MRAPGDIIGTAGGGTSTGLDIINHDVPGTAQGNWLTGVKANGLRAVNYG